MTKKLISVSTFPCSGEVNVSSKEGSNHDIFVSIPLKNTGKQYPNVQHFEDGSTKVLCPRTDKDRFGHINCFAADEIPESTRMAILEKLRLSPEEHEVECGSCSYSIVHND